MACKDVHCISLPCIHSGHIPTDARLEHICHQPWPVVSHAIPLPCSLDTCLLMQEPQWVISRTKAERFFVAVEATYRGDNSYHNSVHAADVAQAAMMILKAGQNSMAFSKLEVFSLICAAAVHDLGHPGYTNDFLINTQHHNAIVYNDRSVNENFHVSSAFRIVSQSEETNIFSGLSRAEYVQVSQLLKCMPHTCSCMLAAFQT